MPDPGKYPAYGGMRSPAKKLMPGAVFMRVVPGRERRPKPAAAPTVVMRLIACAERYFLANAIPDAAKLVTPN